MARYALLVVCLMFVLGCGSGKPATPLERLTRAADAHRLATYEDMIAVPYAAFPAGKLSYWKDFSEKPMLIKTDGGISRIYVHFDEDGDEITGVSIVWFGSSTTAGFPYRLNPEETIAFIDKAIAQMN
jgi:hypothetical protein